MKVFAFKASNHPIGNFSIDTLHDMVDGFRDFLQEHTVLPYDYLECEGSSWTVVRGEQGLRLKEGRIPKPKSKPKVTSSAPTDIPMSTTPEIPGEKIAETRGLVFGETVVHTGMFRSGAESQIKKARNEAIAEMVNRARMIDADAIVGISIDFEDLANTSVVIVAAGTAVKLAPPETTEC